MKITRFVRIQLIIFSIVTVIAMVAMGVFYIKIPAMFGIGRYQVHLDLPSTGGLYQNANVSYRGVNVGKVTSVYLTSDGVRAELSIEDSAKIPASSDAAVRSVSAVGEQYVEFTPRPDGPSGYLHDGSTVTSDDVPVEIASMLDQADQLLAKVGDTKLRAVIDEAFIAFNGTGEDLRRLIDSMILLVDDADKNSAVTIDLVRQAGPLLATQSATADEIRAWTADVTKVTDQLRADNPEITDILQKGPSTATQSEQLFASMNDTLPMLISNLGVSSKTLAVYLPNLQQVLVIYPRLIDALLTALNAGDPRYGPSVEFSLGFQDPPPCTVGFLPRSDWRFPSAQTPRDLPPGLLCRVPQNAQVAVRGARNYPCVEYPGRRAPTPEECRTGYQPLPETNDAFPNGLPGVKLPNEPAGYVTPGTPSDHEPGPAVYATTYDPRSGDFIGPDGKTYNAGTGQDSQGHDSTWQSLITRTVDG
ncbi:MCE family protein [Gordonia rhizosphera]|uniref:Mce family protein n=1 Tax=Gordonia rhizosphera NBRC 16068 TaxID=1108045 RepID=K6W286_9ACTN|nr:MlaD family protein [Gordonia rhizosphera]GAB93280.1 Mce family protein [Gordonia rhizosphera NBRC 16068]